MKITDVYIQLAPGQEGRLRGFARVTFSNAFVVRDIRIVQGDSCLFVAMPSRRLTAPCMYCGSKNHLHANYCNQCGKRAPLPKKRNGAKQPLYADIAHPINERCRSELEAEILTAYRKAVEQRQPRKEAPATTESRNVAGAMLL